MNPIAMTITHLAGGTTELTTISRTEIALKFIEERANKATNAINSLATGTLERTRFTMEYYPQEIIKFLAKTIRKLSFEQRHEGNRLYSWDNRFNKIHKPVKCGIRRITLRPCARHSLRAGKGTSVSRDIDSRRNLASWRDFLTEILHNPTRTPINSEEISMIALPK